MLYSNNSNTDIVYIYLLFSFVEILVKLCFRFFSFVILDVINDEWIRLHLVLVPEC